MLSKKPKERSVLELRSFVPRRKKIAVIFGGCSPEYEVSLQSAYAVITNMDSRKYEPVMIGITKEGDWYRYNGHPKEIVSDSWWKDPDLIVPAMFSPNISDHGIIELNKTDPTSAYAKIYIDAAFPVLHGRNGEDGTVQGMIEHAGIPLVGCGTLASAICMDKNRAHRLVHEAGVRVPKGMVVSEHDGETKGAQQFQQLSYPLFVKPVNAGSSFGITRVVAPEQLENAIHYALQYDDQAIIEEAIEGFEVGCAILGAKSLIVGEVDEIELQKDFFDYTEKYTLKTSAIYVPARISDEKREEIKKTAVRIYKVLGCSGFARVDMFLTPDGEIVFNEVNTIPGLTPHSRYPGMMKAAGYEFSQMIDLLIEAVMHP